MTDKLKPCPFCGGEEYVRISATGGEWVRLIIDCYGSISPKTCLGCGLIYVDKDVCEKIKNRSADNEQSN